MSPHSPTPAYYTPPIFSSFTSVTVDEVSKLLSQSPDTNCDLDPIPPSLESLLKQCSSVLLLSLTYTLLSLHFLMLSFEKNLKLIFSTFLSLLSLLPFLWTDISGINLAMMIHIILISTSFIHTSSSFTATFLFN